MRDMKKLLLVYILYCYIKFQKGIVFNLHIFLRGCGLVSASIMSNYLRNSTSVQTPNSLPVRSLFKIRFSKKKKERQRCSGFASFSYYND